MPALFYWFIISFHFPFSEREKNGDGHDAKEGGGKRNKSNLMRDAPFPPS